MKKSAYQNISAKISNTTLEKSITFTNILKSHNSCSNPRSLGKIHLKSPSWDSIKKQKVISLLKECVIRCKDLLYNWSNQLLCSSLEFLSFHLYYEKVINPYNLLNFLNFLNEIIHLPCKELSIITFRDTKMRTWSWSANSLEPGCADWPGSIQVAKTNHFQFQQGKNLFLEKVVSYLWRKKQ